LYLFALFAFLLNQNFALYLPIKCVKDSCGSRFARVEQVPCTAESLTLSRCTNEMRVTPNKTDRFMKRTCEALHVSDKNNIHFT